MSGLAARRACAAEFLGTALLVLAVVGSGIQAQRLSPDDTGLALLENAIATGAALAAIIAAFGPVSGAHLNPVVTVVDRVLGGAPRRPLVRYLAAQLSGGIAGAVLANVMFGLAPVSVSDRHRATLATGIAEAVATFGLLLVIHGVLRSGRSGWVPAVVAAYITGAYWFTSSTSFANPAVTVARLFSDTFAGIGPGSVAPFVLAQAVGGLVAVAAIRFLFGPDAPALPAPVRGLAVPTALGGAMTVFRPDPYPPTPESAAHSCDPDGGCCRPAGRRLSVNRRLFLTAAGAGAATLALTGREQAALAFDVPESCVVPVPADKGHSAEWIAALSERGEQTVLTGEQLRYVGMPVGGGCCGTVYLGGDGRLWQWDISNIASRGTDGSAYDHPYTPGSPFRQGVVLRVTDGADVRTYTLDSAGFDDITFTGRYPIGRVDYRAAGCPVEVTLEAFSPYVPLDTDASTTPVIVLAHTLRNTGDRAVTAELLCHAASPVSLRSRTEQAINLTSTPFTAGGVAGTEFGSEAAPSQLPETVFEDWSGDSFDGWTVTGDAFGTGPVAVSALPPIMTRYGELNARGGRLVTSYDVHGTGADSRTGSLTSTPFTIEHSHIGTRIGGGVAAHGVGVEILVAGAVVASAAGTDTEPLVPVAFDVSAHQGEQATIRIVDTGTGAWSHLNVGAIVFTDRPDIVFESFEGTAYDGWTATGTAFGAGPVTVDEVPDGMKRFGGFNALGNRFVTSYDYRGTPANSDGPTGKLTSAPFTVERRFVLARVGGGNNPDLTGLHVVVDGTVVAARAGDLREPMTPYAIDVSDYTGKQATIEVVDGYDGGWGHVNVDGIVFSDHGLDEVPFAELPDTGTFALAAADPRAAVRPSVVTTDDPADLFDAADAPTTVNGGTGTVTATVTVPVQLAAGVSDEVRFLLGWNFPIPDRSYLSFLTDIRTLRRHYATRYASAQDVVGDTGGRLAELEAATRLWVRTWYDDTTLPHWFAERTFATASTLATSNCYHFDNGRFYGYEGVYCCDGTCEHVWNYAQSISRLFPELERDARERVDLGIGFHADTGEMGFRAEADMSWATDGECGTILRIYREHLMTTDSSFVRRNWPHIRRAVEFLIGHDVGSDGIIDGAQPNTLDTIWYGRIAWISGMYVGALSAAAEMADIAGDNGFAATCRTLAASGRSVLETDLWTGEYFIQEVDAAHPEVINTNKGSHIDQMFGQSLATQVGLPRVFPYQKSRTALANIYRYNYTPDALGDINPLLPGPRTFSDKGEPGTLMATWPHCGAETAAGEPASWAAEYFNEVWTGQEYQLAAQMMYDDVIDESLIITRAIHDRYDPVKRNLYNEVECGDHYARAMAGYGVFLGACGFGYDGPRRHIAFAPRIRPADFAAAFTAATGWGSYRQQVDGEVLTATIEVRHGTLDLRSIGLQTPWPVRAAGVTTPTRTYRNVRRQSAPAPSGAIDTTVLPPAEITLSAGESVLITLTGRRP